MSRNITILGLVQMLLVILGFFGLGIVMKINGYPSEDFGIRWNPLALLLRRHGLILLLMPVAWTICAALSQSRESFILSQDGWAALGIVLALIIVSLFIYACVTPFYRPLLIGL
jgi:hypothetical protein